ncbi:MAG: hypothetical protein U9N62_03675 [Thermotogota bacterium]|nr:hypothetical protein [Thermotogota bacterium]
MKLDISVPEVVNIFKEIKEQLEQLYEMIRADIRETKELITAEKWQAPSVGKSVNYILNVK